MSGSAITLDAGAGPAAPIAARRPWVLWAAVAVASLAGLYAATVLYSSGQAVFGSILLAVTAFGAFIFTNERLYRWRYVYPAIAGLVLFSLFPLGYTIAFGFTNYSARNLLTFDRVQAFHQDQVILDRESAYALTLHPADGGMLIRLSRDDGDFQTEAVDLTALPTQLDAAAAPDLESIAPAEAPRTIVQNRDALQALSIALPDGRTLQMAGLREYAQLTPTWTLGPDDTLIHGETGAIMTPDHTVGFYRNEAGETVAPGWRVNIGFDNFVSIMTDDGIAEPFLQIFIWTIVFAVCTVVFTFALGLFLAVLLNWEHLKYRAIYRVLLIMPYAVPAFISILVFRGLFNQNFGEINLILESLIGFKPQWFTDAGLARTMLLIVNTWLGYPYMMILALGLLQAVPRDLYEASAIDGSGPVRNFFTITLPVIFPSFAPLLVASFAFNFNNFILIVLLTGGLPDIIGTQVPAGTTDILASFTYRIAFADSGQQFGLASAISTLIFLLVGVISIVNLRFVRQAEKGRG